MDARHDDPPRPDGQNTEQQERGVTDSEPPTPPVEVALDDDEEVHRCSRCERPFRRERQRDLHLGEAHTDLDDDETVAYEAAVQDEEDELFFFHMKVVVTLGVLYASTVLLYTAIVGLTG